MIDSGGWKRTCARCRVDRHDRCVGPGDCGCTDPSHETPSSAEAQAGFFTVADEPAEGTIHHLDPDDETVIVEMSTGQYAQLVTAAQAQERDPGVVLRRALEHYLHCDRTECRHHHDERPDDAPELSAAQLEGQGEDLLPIRDAATRERP